MGYDKRYGFEISEKYPERCAGVIIRFDAFASDCEKRLRTVLRKPKMLGVRFTMISPGSIQPLVERSLDPFFKLAEQVDTAVQLFAPYCVVEMHETVRRFPKIRWLIDHMAVLRLDEKDNRDPFRQWADLMMLAEEPNVWIKCSYFPEAVRGVEPYPYPTAQRYFRQLYEHVGPSHLIWGSNYPPVTQACTYKQAVDFAATECDFLTPADRETIMGANFMKYFAR
jgi:predicted TIM-barrel fold metal-dependent hydrolase